MDTMTYNSRLCFKTVDAFRAMREDGLFLDGLLIAGGKSENIHLPFIAAHSKYLRKLFSDLAPNKEFEFDNITSRGLHTAVHFAYYQTVTLSADTFADVLDAAVCLEFDELVGFCNDFSQKRPDLWLTKMNIAEKFSSSSLAETVLINSSLSEIINVLSSDDFLPNEGSELNVLRHALTWLRHHKEEWKTLPHDEIERFQAHLLDCDVIRYGLFTDMHVVLDEINKVKELGISATPLGHGTQFHKHVHKHPIINSIINRPRCKDVSLLIMGGSDGKECTRQIYQFRHSSPSWVCDDELGTMYLPQKLATFSTAVVGSFVYVAGGQQVVNGRGKFALNEMHRLNTITNKWLKCATLCWARAHFVLCPYEGIHLLASGGIRTDTLDSVEIYDLTSDSWERGQPVPEPLSGHAGVTVGDNVYICGGTNNKGTVRDAMYRFERRTWIKLGRMHTQRTGHSAVVHNDTIFVCGGIKWEGKGKIKHVETLESYNTLNGQWTELHSLPEPRVYASLCVWSNKLYVVGGSDMYKLDASVTMLVYNLQTNTWLSARVPLPQKTAKGSCVILAPPEKRAQETHNQCKECQYLNSRMLESHGVRSVKDGDPIIQPTSNQSAVPYHNQLPPGIGNGVITTVTAPNFRSPHLGGAGVLQDPFTLSLTTADTDNSSVSFVNRDQSGPGMSRNAKSYPGTGIGQPHSVSSIFARSVSLSDTALSEERLIKFNLAGDGNDEVLSDTLEPNGHMYRPPLSTSPGRGDMDEIISRGLAIHQIHRSSSLPQSSNNDAADTTEEGDAMVASSQSTGVLNLQADMERCSSTISGTPRTDDQDIQLIGL